MHQAFGQLICPTPGDDIAISEYASVSDCLTGLVKNQAAIAVEDAYGTIAGSVNSYKYKCLNIIVHESCTCLFHDVWRSQHLAHAIHRDARRPFHHD